MLVVLGCFTRAHAEPNLIVTSVVPGNPGSGFTWIYYTIVGWSTSDAKGELVQWSI